MFSALAGGSLFSTNTESAVVTGNVRVSNGDFSSDGEADD